nr:unnamed protein product [Spirometra erinaceieuropaei]
MITIDRYLSVTHAVRYRNWRTDNKLKVMLALSWILPTALWTTVIFGWYHFTDDERPPPTACNVPFTHFTLFNTLLTVGYFWIPLVFITSLYVRIYNVAAHLQRKAMTAEMGLAELMMMAGTTMSKIGLGVDGALSPDPAKELKAEAQPANRTPKTSSNIGKLGKESESRSTSGEQTTAQTDCLSRRCVGNETQKYDESNSSCILENLEFSANYMSIPSPATAASSGSSSMYSENQGPWVQQEPEVSNSVGIKECGLCRPGDNLDSGGKENQYSVQFLPIPQ